MVERSHKSGREKAYHYYNMHSYTSYFHNETIFCMYTQLIKELLCGISVEKRKVRARRRLVVCVCVGGGGGGGGRGEILHTKLWPTKLCKWHEDFVLKKIQHSTVLCMGYR